MKVFSPDGGDRLSSMGDGGLKDGAKGVEDPVACWLRDLKAQLTRLAPYLVDGRMVTFRHITMEEKAFFADLVEAVRIPETACAVFIPPSVVQQAMWPGIRKSPSDESAELYGIAPDAGAVVAVRRGSLTTIVNALFALPPLAPGIDVYQNDRLLAGYTYRDPEACADGLSETLDTYLG